MADNADRAAAQAEVLDPHILAARPRMPVRSVPGRECMSCGEDIAPERLAVLPGACLCIECQEDVERVMR